MFAWNLAGTQKERLTHYKDLARSYKVNELSSLNFSVVRNERNAHAYDLMENESAIEYDGIKYIIKDLNEIILGDASKTTVKAEHEFFTRMMKGYVYGTLTDQKRSVDEYMNFLLGGLIGTSFTFSVIDSIPAKKLENFGADYPLALFQKLLNEFQIEFLVIGNDIRIYERIGSQTGYPYRYKHNISNISKNGTGRNLSTYIKGFGKEYEEKDMLTGESRNMTGFDPAAWFDKTEPYYGSVLGAVFRMEYYGTGVRFNYYAAPDGGIIEFTLDGDENQKATVSCWASKGEVRSIDLFRDAEQAPHTIRALFKGEDPKHKPTLNGLDAPRCYVLYRSGSGQKTYDIYKLREGDDKYTVISEYTSPLASTPGIGIIPQAPVYNQDITTKAELDEYLKGVLNDKIDISYTTDIVDLAKMGGPIPRPKCGDRVPFIVEKMNLFIKDIRIMELTEYPEQPKSPTIVLGNSAKDFGEAAFNATKQQLDLIVDPKSGKVKIDVLAEAVKRATAALNNSLTQVEYPANMGILLRDPTDYNRFVVLRSSGIGVTTDGGITFPDAITADGVVTDMLTAGTIHTNNIQIIGVDSLFYWDGNQFISIDPNNPNKFAKITPGEFYVKGGGFVVERPDGYKVIDNGIIQYGYVIQGMTPQFCSPQVTIAPRSCYTNSTDAVDFQAYEFKHDGRYLRVRTSQYQSGGGTCYMSVEQSYEGFDGWRRWALLSSTVAEADASSDATERETLIDFGVPTGTRKRIYIRIWSSRSSTIAYGRVTGIWQEG